MNSNTSDKRFAVTRGCNTVRSRCMQFVDALRQRGYERLPLEQAKQQFSLTLGIFDRSSLKAYFGTQAGISRHTVNRFARYQSGTVGLKTIELSQRITHQIGYLENLGLVEYELTGKTWFAILKSAILVPTLMKSDVAMRNFSLSQSLGEEDSRGVGFDVETEGRTVVDVPTITTNKQQQHRVRERNRSSESERIQNCIQTTITSEVSGLVDGTKNHALARGAAEILNGES